MIVRLLYTLLFLFVVLSSASLLANSQQQNVDASLRITRALKISADPNSSGLLFPKILAGQLTTVNSEDQGVAGSTGHNAKCNVKGEPLFTYGVSGVDSMVLTSDNGTINVTLAFRSASGTMESMTLSNGQGFGEEGTGTASFEIIGTAYVESKPRGTYIGTKGITVNYN